MSSTGSLYDLLAHPATLPLLRVWPLGVVPEAPYSIADVIPLRTEHLSAGLERDEHFRFLVSDEVVYLSAVSKHVHPTGIGPIEVNAIALIVESIPPRLVSVVALPSTLISPGEGWTMTAGARIVVQRPRGE